MEGLLFDELLLLKFVVVVGSLARLLITAGLEDEESLGEDIDDGEEACLKAGQPPAP